MAEPCERPILFSSPMICQLLSGVKSQTRRVVKPQPPDGPGRLFGPEWYTPAVEDRQGEIVEGKPIFGVYGSGGEWRRKCPWQPGQRLWVRETWAVHGLLYDDLPAGKIDHSVKGGAWSKGDSIWYRATDQYHPATGKCSPDQRGKWRSSIFMPRSVSRITLEVTGVRVERVQEISDEDIEAEGTPEHSIDTYSAMHEHRRDDFRYLWNSINSKRGYGWDANPWVFVISFKRIE